MRKLILTAVALMCSGLWAVAQSSSTPDTSSASPSGQSAGAPSSSSSGSMSGSQSADTPSSSASSTGAATTVDGCLSGSAGNYTIKDKATGTTYNLSGATSSLAAHVGHEVQITGSAASASSTGSASSSASSPSSSASSSPSSASGTGNNQTLNVTSAKMVSSSCSNQ